jgi:hypothetical protein
MTPLNFLNLLWQLKPEEMYVLIWTLHDKSSHWYCDVAAAAEFVVNARGLDVYVGVGLSRADRGPTHRCVSDDVAGISGFWADLDLKSEAHSKALPATIADAISIIPECMPPTVVIATGNGAHAWWLFKEPYVFDDAEDRKDTAMLVSRWQTLLRLRASQHGWAFDRLSDLARVLRIPGTVNLKDPSNPKPVTLHSATDRRYNLSDFEDYLDDAAVPDPEAEEKATREWAERFADKALVIDINARIPQEMLDGWMVRDLRFKNTWLRQRHDLKDQSQSGYDMALAAFGAQAGLTEQQIVDLIVHHRSLYQGRSVHAWTTSNGPSRRHSGPVWARTHPWFCLARRRFPPRPVRLRRLARPLRRVQVDRPIEPPSIRPPPGRYCANESPPCWACGSVAL